MGRARRIWIEPRGWRSQQRLRIWMLTGFPCVLVSATQSMRSSNARAVIRVGRLWRTATHALALHITKPITWRCCAQVFTTPRGRADPGRGLCLCSFRQSEMYGPERGLYGVSHAPHRRALGGICRQCHSPAGNPAFPTLRLADHDDPAHHFHPPESTGAACVSSHMIKRVYMDVDWRRDRSFRIPRPDLGPVTGSPDACTDCHRDQTQAWVAAEIAQRFPNSAHRGPHYGQVLSRGRTDPLEASGDLPSLATEPNQPGIVRATAAYLLSPAPTPDAAKAAEVLAGDPDHLVRASAAHLLRPLPLREGGRAMARFWTDTVRNVRIEAARETLDTVPSQLTPSQRAAIAEAQRDWRDTIRTRLDFPEAHLVLGGATLTIRDFAAAIEALREVVRLDPQRIEAWTMLVRFADAMDGRATALEALDEAIEAAGQGPDLLRLSDMLGH